MRTTNFLFLLILSSSFSVFSQGDTIGKSFIDLYFNQKNFTKTYELLDPSITNQVNVDFLSKSEQQISQGLGKLNSILEINQESGNYYYYLAFEKMKLDLVISVTPKNTITGFVLKPHKTFSTAATLGQEYTVNSHGFTLKGTLLQPMEPKKKLVVFCHGSGPNDRDEKIGEYQFFKTLAEQMYQEGISSYRFDKRTFTYPESFNDSSTIDDEVCNDILSIVNHFKSNETYKNYELIVVGHSLGGYLIPRIASKTTNIDKLAVLAGSARPLETLLEEQFIYLNSIDTNNVPVAQLKAIQQQIAYLHSSAFSLNSPKEQLPMNVPAAYWNSLKSYQPTEVIQTMQLPIFVAQGERDYQVTMTDFTAWKTALSSNKRSKCITYSKLNHLFVKGKGKASPKEYFEKGEIDKNFIKDLTEFIQN